MPKPSDRIKEILKAKRECFSSNLYTETDAIIEYLDEQALRLEVDK